VHFWIINEYFPYQTPCAFQLNVYKCNLLCALHLPELKVPAMKCTLNNKIVIHHYIYTVFCIICECLYIYITQKLRFFLFIGQDLVQLSTVWFGKTAYDFEDWRINFASFDTFLSCRAGAPPEAMFYFYCIICKWGGYPPGGSATLYFVRCPIS